MLFNAAGAIDALAAVYPKTLMRLHTLLAERPAREETLEEARRLQWLVSSTQQWIVEKGARGIREAIFRVLGFGNLEGGRAPLRGRVAEGEWEKWSELMTQIGKVEASL